MIVPDDSTAKAALQRGDIDIIEDLSNSDVPVLRQDPNVRVAYAPVMSMTALLMQTRDPLLADPRLRQALAHAIDYAQLAAAVTEAWPSPIIRSCPWCRPITARRSAKAGNTIPRWPPGWPAKPATRARS